MDARYLLRRVLLLTPAVVGILLIGFLLVHLAPGDPVLALAGEHGDAAYYADIRQRFGLDRPLTVQLATYARRVLTGDLGTSFVHGRPVAAVIAERLPATALLTGSALLLSTIGGIVIGASTATRAYSTLDAATNAVTLAVFAAPVFWVGQLAVLVFAAGLGWFPVQGMTDPRTTAGGLLRVLDVLHHLALPAVVLASQQLAVTARVARAATLAELGRPYVLTARSKGMPGRRILWVHVLRRALLPVATVVGHRVGHLLAGSVVVETVFGWPGIGRLALAAIQTRDQPLILGLFLFSAATVVVANLITDIAYAVLDPRIRYR